MSAHQLDSIQGISHTNVHTAAPSHGTPDSTNVAKLCKSALQWYSLGRSAKNHSHHLFGLKPITRIHNVNVVAAQLWATPKMLTGTPLMGISKKLFKRCCIIVFFIMI